MWDFFKKTSEVVGICNSPKIAVSHTVVLLLVVHRNIKCSLNRCGGLRVINLNTRRIENIIKAFQFTD